MAVSATFGTKRNNSEVLVLAVNFFPSVILAHAGIQVFLRQKSNLDALPDGRFDANQFFLRPNAFSTKLKSNTWLGGISFVTAKLFLVKSIAPRIQASSK